MNGKADGPRLDKNGMFYVSWTSSKGKFWERWFHTVRIAEMWLAEWRQLHP